MRKILIPVMSVLLVFLLVCCSASGESFSELSYDDSETLSLEGYTCRIKQHTSNDQPTLSNMGDGNPFGFISSTVSADEALERIREIEDKLSCTIVLNAVDTGSNAIAFDIISGGYQGEIIYTASQSVSTELKNMGALYPLDHISTLDLSDPKYGGPNVHECHALDGLVYGVCPINWLYKQPRTIGVFVFNNELGNRYGLANPTEYLETGTWSWAAIEEVLVSHTIDDGSMSYTALACRFFDFIKMAVFGNGCEICYYDQGGNLKTDITGDNALEAYEWCKKLATEFGDCFTYGTRNIDWAETTAALIDETSMISLTANSIVYENFIWEMNDTTMMPFPNGPKAEYGSWSSIIEASDSFAVYLTAKEPDAGGLIITMLSDGLKSTPDYDALCQYMADSVLNNIQDARILMDLYKYGRYSYWNGTNVDEYWRGFVDGQIVNKSISQLIGSKESVLMNILEKNVAPNIVIFENYSNR